MKNLIKWKLFKFSWISGFSNTSYQYWRVEVTLEYFLFQASQYFHFEKGISALCKTRDAAVQLCLWHAKPHYAAGILAEYGSPGYKVNLYWLSLWKQTGGPHYFKNSFIHLSLFNFFCFFFAFFPLHPISDLVSVVGSVGYLHHTSTHLYHKEQAWL